MLVNWLPWSGSWSNITSLIIISQPLTSAIVALASIKAKPPVVVSNSLIPTTKAVCWLVNPTEEPSGKLLAGPFA